MSSISAPAVLQRAAEWARNVLRTMRTWRWIDAGLVLVGLALAAALRYSLLDFRSIDFFSSLKPWYNTIKTDGFAAFATGFSNYNPPYLYLLYIVIRFLPALPIVVAVKLPAIIADFVCAYVVYLIVRLRYGSGRFLPYLAGLAVLFAPTVVLNSAFWGQADSLFTAGLLACVYLLMIRKPWPASICFGLALSFKLQAIFLAPVIFAVLFRKGMSWKALLLVPLVLACALVPSAVAGRPVADLLNVYFLQTSQYESITMNAPTAYAWLPGSKDVFNALYVAGIIMGGAAAFMWFTAIWRSPRPISPALLLEVSLCALLLVPFFLPKMHERYFYPADIAAIALAFFCPSLFLAPIVVVGVSFFSYQPFLFETVLVPLPLLSLALLAVISTLVHHSMLQMYSPEDTNVENRGLPPTPDNA